MRLQTYFNTPFEFMANICDMSKDISINCVGAVDDSIDLENADSRNDYYIMYVVKGGMDIKFGSCKDTIHAGNLLIMSPGTHYRYSAKKGEGLNYLWLHFTGKRAEDVLKEVGLTTNTIFDCGYIGSVVECWGRMCNEFIINDDHFEQMTLSIFNEILNLFSRRLNSNDEKKRFLRSIMYIHEHFQDKITVEYLASMENLSESHYRAIFARIFGESPIEYIISRRIDAAIYMLRNSDKSLAEIAEFAGYNDVYYFSRHFKRKTGISPGQYRKYGLK